MESQCFQPFPLYTKTCSKCFPDEKYNNEACLMKTVLEMDGDSSTAPCIYLIQLKHTLTNVKDGKVDM